jgi:hypothetical protein
MASVWEALNFGTGEPPFDRIYSEVKRDDEFIYYSKKR